MSVLKTAVGNKSRELSSRTFFRVNSNALSDPHPHSMLLSQLLVNHRAKIDHRRGDNGVCDGDGGSGGGGGGGGDSDGGGSGDVCRHSGDGDNEGGNADDTS